jgi:hypothetical protein
MTQNGIPPEGHDKIVQFVSSFALYGSLSHTRPALRFSPMPVHSSRFVI